MRNLFLIILLLLPSVMAAQKFNEYDRKVFNEGQPLREYNVEFASYTTPWDPVSCMRVYCIHDEGDETIVTFSYSIYYDSQWLAFSKGIYVEDERNGDIYKVRGYTDGLTMDRLLIVDGCKGKNILVSLRFPKFKRGVRRITIHSPGHVDDIKPSNRRSEFRKVLAKNVDVKKMRRMYKERNVFE